MWKPYNVPEPCKWRSKKINAALYPFLMLCLCVKRKEHYQNLKHLYIWVYIKWSHFYKVKNSELQERLFLKQSDRCLTAEGKPNCWHRSSYLWLVLGGWAVRPVSQSVCRVKKKHVYLIPFCWEEMKDKSEVHQRYSTCRQRYRYRSEVHQRYSTCRQRML